MRDDITRVTLANGITVLSRPNFSSLSVVINGYLPVGSLFDTDEELGLAHFVASSLCTVPLTITSSNFTILELVGPAWDLARVHTTGFNGHALAEELPLLLKLFAEVLQEPVFPPEEVERLRAHLLTSLAIRAQDTQEMSSLTFDQIVYAGHPYQRPDDGFPDDHPEDTRSMIWFHSIGNTMDRKVWSWSW